MEQQQQQQQQYGNTGSVHGSGYGIQEKIKNASPLIIRILAYVQSVLSLLIFAMEIGIIACYALFGSATTSSAAALVGPLTAAGIWTSIVMDIAIGFLFRLWKHTGEKQMWMINTTTQCLLFIFAIILIGITGNYVSAQAGILAVCNVGLDTPFGYVCTKYRLHQAQLAFAILMLFSAILFIGLFLYFYFVMRSFPSSIITPVNPWNPNVNPGIQPYESRLPTVASQLPPNNAMWVAPPSSYVSKQVECSHCHATVPLPVPRGTYNPTQ